MSPAAATPGDARLTLNDLLDRYLDAHVRVPERSKASQVVMECLLNRLTATSRTPHTSHT